MRYLIWGIGERLENSIDDLNLDNIIGFVDKKAVNTVMKYHGKPLIEPKDILIYEFDYIVISSNKYFDEISIICITELGVDCKKILRLDYLLGKERKDFYDFNIQLGYRDVKKLIDGWEQTSIVRNWLGKEVCSNQYFNKIINCKGYIYNIFLENTSSICIYQVTHKKFQEIKNEGYSAIGVGTKKLPYLRDNSGDNIAIYNEKINECTALYWIWKNSKAAYIGLNHYRRVFGSELNMGWPLQDVEALLMLRQYDVIVSGAVAFKNNSVISMLRKEICKDAFDRSWEVLVNIFNKRGGTEKTAFEKVMNGGIIFPCNMFIMDRKKVDKYCNWLFPILFELVDKVEIEVKWDDYSKRVIGFWAERMLTVWLYLSEYRVKELPVLSIGDCKPYGK